MIVPSAVRQSAGNHTFWVRPRFPRCA